MDLLLDDCAGVPYAMPDGSGNVTVEIPADIFAENSEIGCIHRAARGSSRS